MGVNKKNYDFSGWVTKNNVRCSDGRTIRHNAFAHMDGRTVPLVYNHEHNDINNVLGQVLLENRKEGVYGYAKTNSTENGVTAKELVHSGDIVNFSIYANHLREKDGDVMHGDIQEVSLVLAGANPEALIDTFLEHSFDGDEEHGMYFFMGESTSMLEEYLEHKDKDEDEKEEDEEDEEEAEESDESEEEDEEDEDEDEEEKKMLRHADDETSSGQGQTLKEAYEEMPEKYKKVCAALVGMAVSGEAEDEGGEVEHSGLEGGEYMKHNVFENDTQAEENVLQHSDITEIISNAKRSGSLKREFEDYCLAHSIDTTGMTVATGTQTYGFNDVSMVLPDYKAQSAIPEWIKRDTTWCDVLMNGVHKVPFKRIKSMFANITEDEARAKGYIKGTQKVEEVFSTLKRTTDPQTIYKLQKLDRDDILDIEDFDVVAWIKGEMQIMLNEEKARAVLIGDGRGVNDPYKIQEAHIRPIVTDVPLFNIKVKVDVKTTDTEDGIYKNFIKAALRARKDYKGSGNPILFTTEEVLTELLLLEDGIGHPLYKTEAELATKLRVSRIVTVEVMEGATVDYSAQLTARPLMGVIVNPNDYTVGGDGNREKGMFEDFDIDFNQYKYLIETRMSGALTRPYSAITILRNNLPAQQSGSGNG